MDTNRLLGGVVVGMTNLGSRLSVVSIAVLIAVLTSDCGKDPCAGDVCDTGGGGQGGTAGEGGQGGDGGAGGIVVTGAGGSGAEGGGAGGSGGQGGAGGATTASGDGGGGEGGGPCVPTFACGPKDCGIVDDGCGMLLNCDAAQGDPVTCGTQSGGNDGPMVCGEDHLCYCPPEGNSAEAMTLCDGTVVLVPGVSEYCASHGGCDTAYCGTPPVAKRPEHCKYAGGFTTEEQIWCCAKQP